MSDRLRGAIQRHPTASKFLAFGLLSAGFLLITVVGIPLALEVLTDAF